MFPLTLNRQSDINSVKTNAKKLIGGVQDVGKAVLNSGVGQLALNGFERGVIKPTKGIANVAGAV